MAFVYKHLKPDNNVFYIGIGVVKKRAYSKHGRNRHWHNTVNKNGYKVEIICDDVDYDTAKQIESYLIRFYGRKDLNTGCLVNMTDGGEGNLNMNQEEKLKRAKRLSDYNKTEKDYSFTKTKEYKDKMSKATKNKGCKKIIDTLTKKIYYSLNQAAQEHNISISYLSSMINNKKPNKTNLKWI